MAQDHVDGNVERSAKFAAICTAHFNAGKCRNGCPLTEPCKNDASDPRQDFIERMNAAAENIPYDVIGFEVTGIADGWEL